MCSLGRRRDIPTTLQSSLVARLDRLGAAKDVAVVSAAIGREFTHELVAAVSALAPLDLDAALDRLVASCLVYRRGMPPRDLLVQLRAGAARSLGHDAY